jgi:predicted ATPase
LRREPHARGQPAVQLDLLDDRLAELCGVEATGTSPSATNLRVIAGSSNVLTTSARIRAT